MRSNAPIDCDFFENSVEELGIESGDFLKMFSMTMPKGCVYMQHDHPEMVVFTLVLSGKMEISHYDYYGVSPKMWF